MAIRVLVAGGGIGGLCLAQGLRKTGVAVEVFERDASPRGRGQGFRFRIDADGDTALRACLDDKLYRLYRATSNRPAAPPSAAYDEQMRVIFRMDEHAQAPSQHMAVNRMTLREVLMTGLEGALQFDRRVAGVEQCSGGVTAWLANGEAVRGDVLVAADGIASVVRRQILTGGEPVDTGMRCIYGNTLLDPARLDALPEVFLTGFVPFVGPERRTLAMGLFRSRQGMAEAAAEILPGAKLTPTPDYLMWLCVAPLQAFSMSDEDLRAAGCATLHSEALELTEGWHPMLRQVLKSAEVSTLFQVPIRTVLTVPAWPVTRVTFLGDAIHAMTPAGGIGANTALRDAALLAGVLRAVDSGERDLAEAIGEYETEMRAYSAAAAKRSLQSAAHLYRIAPPEEELAR